MHHENPPSTAPFANFRDATPAFRSHINLCRIFILTHKHTYTRRSKLLKYTKAIRTNRSIIFSNRMQLENLITLLSTGLHLWDRVLSDFFYFIFLVSVAAPKWTEKLNGKKSFSLIDWCVPYAYIHESHVKHIDQIIFCCCCCFCVHNCHIYPLCFWIEITKNKALQRARPHSEQLQADIPQL